MRHQVLKALKQLLIIDDTPVDQVDDVDDSSFPDLDLWLSHLPLDGQHEHSLQQLFAQRS